MSLQISSYRQLGLTEDSVTLLADDYVYQAIDVQDACAGLEAVDLFLRKGVDLLSPITLAIRDNYDAQLGSTLYSAEILASEILSTGFGRVRLEIPSTMQFLASTTYYFLVQMPGSGTLAIKRSTPKSVAYEQNLSFGSEAGKWVDATGSWEPWTPEILAVEMYDIYDVPVNPQKPPVFRTASTWQTEREIAVLDQLYPGYMASVWLFDDYVLPVNPTQCQITEHKAITSHPTLDARKVHVLEKAADYPRIIVGHRIELTFPIVGRDFVVWLQSYAEFSNPFFAQITLFDPPYPEVCYMAELSGGDYYNLRYYGTIGNWRRDSVEVWVDGVAQVSGYTLDCRNGAVIFDEARTQDEIVQVSYIWRPRLKLVEIEPNWIPQSGFVLAQPKVVLQEVDYV